MNGMVAVRQTALNEGHLRPGRTRHTILDRDGRRDFPSFVSLLITEAEGHSEVILWRLCEDGNAAHTHHNSLSEALDQAEYEFEVKLGEWIEINQPFLSLKEFIKSLDLERP